MSKLVLGLDIGITSVGYGVIDIESNSFVDYGVRLFKEGTAAENAKRREKRGNRRLKSRRVTRKNDLKKILLNNNIIDSSYTDLPDPYDLRVKGLSEKLTNDELATVLFQICKHRGSSLETIEEDESKSKEVGKTKETLVANDKLLKEGLFVCQIQKKNLEENGRVRGINNNFRTKDYVLELNQILSNQGLNDDLNEKIIDLIIRRRHFDEGPGSEKSPTIYGQWYMENGELKHIGMIEKMRGKCSVYPDEYRAPKMAYSACLFNLLNDLNNLSFNGEKISKEQKAKVIEIINDKGSITPKQVAKLLDVEIEEITGFRVNKKEEPIISEFKGYKELKKILMAHGQGNILDNKNILDDIIDILTRTKVVEDRINSIQNLGAEINYETLKDLANLEGISGYHSMSFKAIYEINNEMLNTELNQMQILHASNILKINQSSLKGNKKIFADDTAILSPVAKRAQREAMKVVNRLRDIYGEFDSIVVETTREKNSEERKKKIKDTQRYYEAQNKKVIDLMGEDARLTYKQRMKIRLYLDQNGKCAYTLKDIDLVTLINDRNAYEIDHIIPISVSLDDSYNNKVLVTHTANQDKGNLTPFAAFNKGKFKDSSKAKFIANSLELRRNKNISRKKLEYLLCDKDISKYDEMKKFISRNLVDTSYANRVVYNTLSTYFKQNDISTKVHTIRGSATHQFRSRINLDKNREEDYGHHAIDALIVASLKKQGVIKNLLNNFKMEEMYNDDTGEIYNIVSKDEYFDSSHLAFLTELKNLKINKFSHKIDTKPNRQIADETIYSTRVIKEQEKLVRKFKDIYDPKFLTLAEDILNDNYKDKYLMAIHDPQTFDTIINIVKNYAEKYKDSTDILKKNGVNKYSIVGINPLAEYKEEFGMIKKYSKKENAPFITQIKYLDCNLGNHISITKNYNANNKNVVLLQISPYRTDFYKSKDGKYKFVTIRYMNIKYSSSSGKHIINQEWYDEEKNKKGIDDTYEFQFSMHRDELIGIIKKDGEKYEYANRDNLLDTCHNGVSVEILKFVGTNSDTRNVIEVKPTYKYETMRKMPTIGKSIIELRKYSTDVLGNIYQIKNSLLKLEF